VVKVPITNIILFTLSPTLPLTNRGKKVALVCGITKPCTPAIIPIPDPIPTVNAIAHLEIQPILGANLNSIIIPNDAGINNIHRDTPVEEINLSISIGLTSKKNRYTSQ
jgi:hypothetical protein